MYKTSPCQFSQLQLLQLLTLFANEITNDVKMEANAFGTRAEVNSNTWLAP